VLEEGAEHAPDGDAVTEADDAWTKHADPARDDLHRCARVGGVIKRLDELRVDEGVGVAASSPSSAMRTAKNSSRFEEAMPQYLIRSRSGRSSSAASASRRGSKSSHDSSRLRKLPELRRRDGSVCKRADTVPSGLRRPKARRTLIQHG
jgi:hypothetical protein